MMRFLLKLLAFFLLLSVAMYFVLLQADGNTDDHYLKFTTPAQKNLIIGTSKAAQGMRPDALKEILGEDFYNYAFTIYHSPYGPTYLRSIQKKVHAPNGDGKYIVTVDPWSISTSSKTPNNPIKFWEKKITLENMRFVNLKPNPFYFLKNYNYNLLRVLESREDQTFLHDDGWLEVDVNMDSTEYINRFKYKIKEYNKNLIKYNYSSLRVEYLQETIEWLEERGDVYLVRLPVQPEVYAIGNEQVPAFDSIMNALEPLTKGYIDMNRDTSVIYQTTDGNHLYKDEAWKASLALARWMKGLD